MDPIEDQISLRCANHPEVETNLRCSRCGKPICVRCVVQTPVGGRCRECANLKKLPVYQAGPGTYVRASIYGLAAAVVCALVLSQVGGAFGLSGILLIGAGYVVGEAVSRGANRRISKGLAGLAGLLTVVAVVAGRAVALFLRLPPGLPLEGRLETAAAVALSSVLGGGFLLLFLALAVIVAVSRVR